MRMKNLILYVISLLFWSLLLGTTLSCANATHPNGIDPNVDPPSNKKIAKVRECVRQNLKSELVSGFDLVNSYDACNKYVFSQEDAKTNFGIVMDGFAIPSEADPSVFEMQ